MISQNTTHTLVEKEVGAPHRIHAGMLSRAARVMLVGAGGNGSQVLSGLARLDRALRAVGHPGGLDVTVYDPDLVSESNVGRQLFYASDVGAHKAIVLTHRLNLAYGLNWRAMPVPFDEATCLAALPFEMVISCVDSARARRGIHRAMTSGNACNSSPPPYWLDLGNRQSDGQVILGEPIPVQGNMVSVPSSEMAEAFRDPGAAVRRANQNQAAWRLPTVCDLFPEILDEKYQEEDAPSCSLAEALTRQDLFINQSVATWALQLLWTLFRKGQVEHHAYFINLESGRVVPRLVPSMQVAKRTKLQVLAGGSVAKARPKRARKAA